MKKTIEEFKGVIPAVLSVFDEQENLDDSGTREFIRFLMSFPIGGLYLTGSTGETFLMDGEERMHQVEVVMDEVGDRVPVVVHVGAMSTRASVKLAEQAAAVGAAGVSSVPPFYFKYTNDQIYGYYRDIAEATDLPMIVYNIPLAGMLSVDMIQRLSGIDNVKGVKYTGTGRHHRLVLQRHPGPICTDLGRREERQSRGGDETAAGRAAYYLNRTGFRQYHGLSEAVAENGRHPGRLCEKTLHQLLRKGQGALDR